MRQDFGVPKNEYSKCMLKVEHPLCAATNHRRPSLKKPVGKVSWEKKTPSQKKTSFLRIFVRKTEHCHCTAKHFGISEQLSKKKHPLISNSSSSCMIPPAFRMIQTKSLFIWFETTHKLQSKVSSQIDLGIDPETRASLGVHLLISELREHHP